jgi:glucosamine 6-phosphate synthetase-like amidotransferase/phosphosugar isomerase protein
MCGIGGVLVYPKNRSVEEMYFIKTLATEIMVENQARGTHSAGMAVFGKKGEFDLFKQPARASEIALSSVFNKFIDNKINESTNNILIHTRFATKGSIENNDNNHPIVTANVVGVHNGMIYNDDEIFEAEKLFRQGQVDSEVIFRLADEQGKELTKNKIKKVAEIIAGMFTFALVSKGQTNKMFIVRNDNPITMVYIKELNIIAFASEKRFLESAIDNANTELWGEGAYISTTECTWMTPPKSVIYEFDTSVDNALEQLDQDVTEFEENYDFDYSYSHFNKAYGYSDGFYTKGSKKKNIEAVSLDSILDTLAGEQMGVDDIEWIKEEIAKEIEKAETRSFSEGYGAGRSSLAEEMEQRESLAYERGLNKQKEVGSLKAVK